MADNAARNFAQKGSEYAKETIDKTKAGATEGAKAMQDSYRTASNGAVEFNLQVIELAQNNMNAAFDFARRLARAQSPSEYLELSVTHARKQWETFTEQAQHLTASAQKLTSDAAGPLQAGMGKVFEHGFGKNS
ncbi:MAG: phasin family protein [Xanthobacteraceae bacterium]